MELPGKSVIITGASRGIGRALAVELAKRHCPLILTALEEDELRTLSDEIQNNFSSKVAALSADLSEPNQRRKFIDWIKHLARSPDILVNNAGTGGRFSKFEHLDWPTIEKIFALNISAFTNLTYELIPLLKTRPQAKIVNISSGIARLPYPGLAVYGAAKGFISSFSESLACELAGTSISVLCFHPGFTRTSFIQSAQMDISKIPKIFFNSPEDIAVKIVNAIRKDKVWVYSDLYNRIGVSLTTMIPAILRISIFKNLFWRLPDEK